MNFIVSIAHAMFGIFLTKHLFVVYLKFRFYWTSWILSVNPKSVGCCVPRCQKLNCSPQSPPELAQAKILICSKTHQWPS